MENDRNTCDRLLLWVGACSWENGQFGFSEELRAVFFFFAGIILLPLPGVIQYELVTSIHSIYHICMLVVGTDQTPMRMRKSWLACSMLSRNVRLSRSELEADNTTIYHWIGKSSAGTSTWYNNILTWKSRKVNYMCMTGQGIYHSIFTLKEQEAAVIRRKKITPTTQGQVLISRTYEYGSSYHCHLVIF